MSQELNCSQESTDRIDEEWNKKCCSILNEITLYCRDECCSNCNCPEDECVLFRIEKIIED